MKNTKYIISFLITFAALLFISGCEDLPPDKYIPETYVEAYLIVDEPIENIIVMTSQPLSSSFTYDESLVSDAEVRITDENNTEYILEFRDSNEVGYYLPDTTVLVQPETEYTLEITLGDGTVITGETTTPARFDWIRPPKDIIQYPKDTLSLPEVDSLEIEWENASGAIWYLLRIRCADTLDYGIYLDNVSNDELNRRIERPWSRRERFYNDVSRWVGAIPNNKTPLVWTTLKWFGRTEVSVYAPDFNFLQWFIHYQRTGIYEPILGSVEGGIGVFGSASVIRKESFVLKNQP